jgi:hypothetical protein
MRTSLNEIRQIEEHLTGTSPAEESVVFNARLIISPLLRLNTALQRKAYTLAKHYARKKLKSDLEAIHEKLFQDPAKADFRKSVTQWFR